MYRKIYHRANLTHFQLEWKIIVFTGKIMEIPIEIPPEITSGTKDYHSVVQTGD